MSDAKATLFIQWQGTTLCGDVTCSCGASDHVCDRLFAFVYRCRACGAFWKMPLVSTMVPATEDDKKAPAASIVEFPVDEFGG